MLTLITASALVAFVQGDLAFSRPVRSLDGAPQVIDARSADLNGDGFPDLYLTLRSDSTALNFRQRSVFNAVALSTGPFEWAEEADLIGIDDGNTVGGGPLFADFDGDGDLDGASLVSSSRRGVAALLINDGTGQFAVRTGPPVSSASGGLQLGDADGDGDLDLFFWTQNFSGTVMTVLTENGVPESQATPLGFGESLFAVVDLDEDGVSDVVSAGHGLSARSGATGQVQLIDTFPFGFEVQKIFAARASGDMIVPGQSAIGLDAEPDIVLETNDGTLLYKGNGTLVPRRQSLVPGILRIDDYRPATLRVSGIERNATYRQHYLFPDPPIRWQARWLPFGPTVRFDDAFVIDLGEIGEFVRFEDLDGDGSDDIVDGGQFSPVVPAAPLPMQSRLEAQPREEFLIDRAPIRRLVLFDVNLDGLHDIVTLPQREARLRVRYATGPGTFAASVPLEGADGSAVTDLSVGINPLSGHPLLVVLSVGPGSVRVERFRGDLGGDGVQGAGSASLPLPGAAATGLATQADLNGDGSLDLFVAAGDQYFWWGLLSASIPTQFVMQSDVDPGLADLDGDGDLDVIGVQGDALRVVRTVPLMTFMPAVTVATGLIGAEAIAASDLDLDGRVDIVVRTATEVLVLKGRGAFVFDPPAVMTSTPPNSGLTLDLDLRDLDGDGVDDVVLAPFNAALGIGAAALLSDGQLGVREFVPVMDKAVVQPPLHFGDVDGDGDLDAVGLEPGGAPDAVLVALGEAVEQIGVRYCSIGNQSGALNSTGRTAILAGYRPGGDPNATISLQASQLPVGTFGMLTCSTTPGLAIPGGIPNNPTLCLAGEIGRYNGPGEVRQAGPSGIANFDVERDSLRTPQGPVPAMAGETWYFQVWYRDVILGESTSRFTEGLEITFE